MTYALIYYIKEYYEIITTILITWGIGRRNENNNFCLNCELYELYITLMHWFTGTDD